MTASTTLPEQKNQPNLSRALHKMVGTTYTDKIGRKGGRVDRLLHSMNKLAVIRRVARSVLPGYVR